MDDDLYGRAIDLVVREQKCSASLLQRCLNISCIKAQELVARLKNDTVITGPMQLEDGYQYLVMTPRPMVGWIIGRKEDEPLLLDAGVVIHEPWQESMAQDGNGVTIGSWPCVEVREGALASLEKYYADKFLWGLEPVTETTENIPHE